MTKLNNENLPSLFNRAIKILKVVAISFSSLFILLLICDKFVMPAYVRLGDEKEMPDVTTLDYVDAYSVLRANGFKVRKDDKYDDYAGEGVVLQQNPAPFTRVKKGRNVRLTVSLGERHAIVPDVRNISERDAEIRLLESNLKVGEKIYQPSNDPVGTVFRQQYEPMMELKQGTRVSITVSTGSELQNVIMPNLIYKSLSDVEHFIKERGLFLGRIQYQTDNQKLPSTVLNQLPPPGTFMNLGDTVLVIVSRMDTTHFIPFNSSTLSLKEKTSNN